MSSRFAVIGVRPSGKAALAAAQSAAGGRYRWNGVLPLRTVLVEWPAGEQAPTGYWITNLPQETPLADLVRPAKLRWRIEHDYRELKHGLGLDHSPRRWGCRVPPHPRWPSSRPPSGVPDHGQYRATTLPAVFWNRSSSAAGRLLKKSASTRSITSSADARVPRPESVKCSS